MQPYRLSPPVISTFIFLLASTPATRALPVGQPEGVPVQMVVTVVPQHGTDAPVLNRESVSVYQGRTLVKIADWVPLTGEQAGMELYLLLDEAQELSQGNQLEDLRHFILSQPQTTKIGVAYMQTGGPKIAQSLTWDHALAAKALHPSLGPLAGGDSPYTALSDLIRKWPASNERREVLMISNGVDLVNGSGWPRGDDPSADAAIADVQRAGVIVFAISTQSGPDKTYMEEVADASGGDWFFYRSSSGISFAPYLAASSRLFGQQYLLTFWAQPAKRSDLQPVKIRAEVPHVHLLSAQKVYVSADKK